jgi:hypothetical protein
MSLREIMDVDETDELKNRTWWWWFWLFFFKPKEGENWKQLMILWGTRNCRSLKVNDMPWVNDYGLKRSGNGLQVPGIAAAWYFDGRKMYDPLFLKKGPLTSRWGDNDGALSLKNGGHCTFTSSNGMYKIDTEFGDLKVKLDIKEWVPHLYEPVPTGKRYLGFLGYKMYKIRASRVEGVLDIGGKADHVEGTTYFQKVRINSPTSPWYFGVFHSARGDYLDYFMPHLGPPMFRRSPNHDSKLDFWERILSKGIHFSEASGKNHSIKNVQMDKVYQRDLPVFRLTGRDGRKKVDMELKCYSRAYWKVEQPLMRVLNTVLYYNEYPAYMTKFRFEEDGRVVTLNDMGFTIGNCEHAWGIV